MQYLKLILIAALVALAGLCFGLWKSNKALKLVSEQQAQTITALEQSKKDGEKARLELQNQLMTIQSTTVEKLVYVTRQPVSKEESCMSKVLKDALLD